MRIATYFGGGGRRAGTAAVLLAVVCAAPAPAADPVAGVAADPAAATPAPAVPAPAVPRSVPAPAAPAAAEALTPAQRQAQAHCEEGFFEIKVGNAEKAIAAFRGALVVDPRNARARFGLGTALIAAEKYGEAIEVLKDAIAADPKDYFVRNNLAWLYATARDIRFRDGKRAVALAQESMLIAPSDYHVWSTLAEGYYVCGDYARAQRSAEEAERLARAAQVDAATVQEYATQVERCRAAARAMDILE